MTRPLLQNAREVVGPIEGVGISIADNPSVDAFQRLRVSNPLTNFDSQLQYDNNLIFWQSIVSGTATIAHLPNESSARLRVVAANDLVIRQTFSYYRYQPGKSQLVLMTGIMDNSDNITRRMGYFDVQNGVFLETDGTNTNMVLRSFTTGAIIETRVSQNNWILDKLNGSEGSDNKSGIDLDITKGQIFFLDLEWLAIGRIRVGFVIDGDIVYCHEFLNANMITSSYMTTANLPLRYEISANGSATGTHDFKQVCSTVISEGGLELKGIPFSASNGTSVIAITTRRPVLTIRPKSTFNGIVNRSLVNLDGYKIYTKDQDVFYELVYGGIVSGTSFSDTDTSLSAVEFDVAGSTIFGGIMIDSGFSTTASKHASGLFRETVDLAINPTLDIDGNHPVSPLTDNLTVVVGSIPGTATDVSSVIKWNEIR